MRKKEPKNEELKLRVEKAKSRLIAVGAHKNAMHYFSLKYPKYATSKETKDRLTNLWYTKISDEQFTKEIESFATYKEVEFQY